MATFQDPTLGHLRRLTPRTAAIAAHMVTEVRRAGVPLYISSSTRTRSRQAELVASGRSQTLRSRHLTGEAFDVDVLGFGRDQIPKWWFSRLGQFGEQHGLRWGGRFLSLRDLGHFENAKAIR